MGTTYTSGVWVAKPGHEQDFVDAWTAFAQWAADADGAGALRLVRDVENERRFMSFAPWESFAAQRAWKESPEFRERMARVQQHVESFEPSTYALVTEVS